MKNIAKKIYLFLIILFLYLPIGVLIVASFNDSKVLGTWKGFTLRWYKEFFQNKSIMNSLKTTLVLAIMAAFTATAIATLACLAINRLGRMSRAIIMSLTNIPMLNAEIVTGLAFMLLFIGIGVSLSFTTVFIAHVTFCIPYAFLSIMPKVKQMDKNMYEAALDLGASKTHAFFSITLPDIMPGVLSGFFLSFTMSLDDFIITHFTRGSGFDTLSTKIYTEVRKGIKPEMYALSTLLFVTVFVLLLLINRSPSSKKVIATKKSEIRRKVTQGLAAVMCAALVIFSFSYAVSNIFAKGSSNVIYVYNWGEYIDPDVIDEFEKETGITVNYEEFETNEEMYTIIAKGARQYDVVCPSDYMIQKMIENNLLEQIDYSKVPNIKNIGSQYLKSAEGFDPENKYSVPYCWGTVGIMYNKTMVKEPIDSWAALFDPKYDNQILMQNSVRDAYCVALSYLGYSINTLNEDEIKQATDLLIKQKPIVQAYVVDQVRDKMIKNAAALGVIYSGEAIYMQRENPNLEYVIPKEGSNVWIDGWVIPKNCKNKEGAEKWIDFLCRPDIALKNFEYITYSTPNEAARELIDDEEIRNSQVAFPDSIKLDKCEVYKYLGSDGDKLYDKYWTKVGAK